MKPPSSSKPTWKDVKTKLANFDQPGLLALVRDLYAANKDNQTFLHARLRLGEDAVEIYKKQIKLGLWPDVYRNHRPSVPQAKRAISDYEKATGDAAGMAELAVYFCELGAGFSREFGNDDQSYLNALVDMFDKAAFLAAGLPTDIRNALHARLDSVCELSQSIGYGVGDAMYDSLAQEDWEDLDESDGEQ
jgi:hypothetical protein